MNLMNIFRPFRLVSAKDYALATDLNELNELRQVAESEFDVSEVHFAVRDKFVCPDGHTVHIEDGEILLVTEEHRVSFWVFNHLHYHFSSLRKKDDNDEANQ